MAMLSASLACWVAWSSWMAWGPSSNSEAASPVLRSQMHACAAHCEKVPTFADNLSDRKACKYSDADGQTGQRLAIVWLTHGWIMSAALAESDGVAMAAAYHP